jgi:chromate transporter
VVTVNTQRTEKLQSIFWSFFKIGAILFGGGYAMLPLLENEIVAKRRWLTQEEMVDVFALAQLIPGVVALNSALFVGHRLRGWRGTLAATLGIACVPFFCILAYALAFDYFRQTAWLERATAGLRPAVAGMMLGIAYTMFVRTGKTLLGCMVACVALISTWLLDISAVKVIVCGVISGIVGYGWMVWRTTRRQAGGGA